MQVQSLPTALPESFNTSDKIQDIHSAYSMTLLLEHAASSTTDPKIRERKLIHARVLGHLLREAPSMRATENVANQVNSCQNNDQLDALGEMYFLHYICAFGIRKNEDLDTESSRSSSPDRLSFETKRELAECMLGTNGEPSQCSEKTRRRALVRDGFRCIVTGNYDFHLLKQCTEIKQEVTADSYARVAPTECVHIIPQSVTMVSGVDDKNAKHEYATSIWTIMSYLGFGDLPKKLAGNGIHTLENVLTLSADCRALFEDLDVWFEAIDDRGNTYAIRAMHQGFLRSFRDNPVTLTSQYPDLSMPDKTFLSIHAACCRIANLSGAADYILKSLDDMEDIVVLAKGGLSIQVP